MNIFLVEDDQIYSEFIRKALGQNPEYNVKAFFLRKKHCKPLRVLFLKC